MIISLPQDSAEALVLLDSSKHRFDVYQTGLVAPHAGHDTSGHGLAVWETGLMETG